MELLGRVDGRNEGITEVEVNNNESKNWITACNCSGPFNSFGPILKWHDLASFSATYLFGKNKFEHEEIKLR